MSKFKKSKRQRVFSDAEMFAMPIHALRGHAREFDRLARMYESEAARMARILKKRNRGGRAVELAPESAGYGLSA